MATNGNSRRVKWLVILIIVGGVIGAVVWHFMNSGSSAPQFQTQGVERGDIIQAVTAAGTLNPVTNVTVGSQISGNIQKLYADWNSPVKANQVVAQLDPSTYQAAVLQAQGDLASATATMELNQIEAKRADELFKSKLISESDHDTAIAKPVCMSVFTVGIMLGLSKMQVSQLVCRFRKNFDSRVAKGAQQVKMFAIWVAT